MRVWTIVAAMAIVAVYLAPASAADKPKDLIIGKWETKMDDKSIVMDFSKDGKLKIVATKSDKSRTVEGVYTFVDDQTLQVELQAGGQKVTQKLKIQLTKDELTATDEENQPKTFKRIR